jgi:hypothetical protein
MQSSYPTFHPATIDSLILLEKLILAKLLSKLPVFYAPEGSLPLSQEPATGLSNPAYSPPF